MMADHNRTRFLVRFLAPTIAAAVITTIAVAGFVGWSANRIDAETLERERQLVERAMTEQIEQMVTAQSDRGVWDEAINAYERRDLRWLVENLGHSAYDYYGHSRTILLDAQLRPVLALREGGQVSPSSARNDVDVLLPMIMRLRSLNGRAAIAAFNAGTRSTPPIETDFMMFDDEPALVSIIPLLSYSGDNALIPGREPIYVSVAMLDEGMASYLGDQYLLSSASFDLQPDTASGRAAHMVLGKSRKTVAWLNWQPEKPGARLLTETLPALLAGLLIAATIIGLLLRNLRQTLTQLQAEREDAQHRALHDPLTGLGNRRLFQAKLAEHIAALPNDTTRLALMALDLDHFKKVNDTLGHDAGDDLLIQVAGRIKALMPADCTLARLGGDEFSLIMPAINNPDQATGLAAAIISSLSTPFSLGTHTASIGASIGIATATHMGASQTELIRHADEALYRAKNDGRNRYSLYSPHDASAPKRRAVHLRPALSQASG